MWDGGLFQKFLSYFTEIADRQALPRARLGEAEFVVSEILTTPGSHPWAGVTALADLQKRLDEPAPASIAPEFCTPASFKLQDDEVELMPLPRLVFGNLASALRALSGEDLVRQVEQYAERHVRLNPYRLQRRALTLHNQPQLGMVGRVEYRLSDDTPLTRALSLLADLAFYTGVGRKTAQGMGMARRIPTPKKEVV